MKFVPVRSYDNYVPAHIDMGLLKEEGIESWLKDEHSVTVNPILSYGSGGIKLMVSELQFDNAHEALIRRQVADIGLKECPNCGSQPLFFVKRIEAKPSSWLESLMSFFLGKKILETEDVYCCSYCGFEIKQPVMGEALR